MSLNFIKKYKLSKLYSKLGGGDSVSIDFIVQELKKIKEKPDIDLSPVFSQIEELKGYNKASIMASANSLLEVIRKSKEETIETVKFLPNDLDKVSEKIEKLIDDLEEFKKKPRGGGSMPLQISANGSPANVTYADIDFEGSGIIITVSKNNVTKRTVITFASLSGGSPVGGLNAIQVYGTATTFNGDNTKGSFDPSTGNLVVLLLTGQYTNLAGSAYINPDGSAVFANGGVIIDNAGNITIAGFKLTTAPTSGYVLTSDSSGNGTWQAPSDGGGTPGGSPTNIQFNDSGSFGGLTGSAVDATNGFLGILEATPTATGHFGIKTVFATSISNFTLGIYLGGGYTFGSGSKVYYVYTQNEINSVTFWDSGVDAEFDEPASSDYDPSSFTAAINPAGSGYIASGLNFQYQIWALYDTAVISLGTVQSNSFGDSNDGTPYSNFLSWAQPVAGTPPNGYLIQMIVGPYAGNYQVVSGLSFQDMNTGWGSPPGSLTNITYGVQGNWTAASGATDYIAINTANTTYLDVSTATTFNDNAGSGWTGGSPNTTPTSYTYDSLISEGTTELVHTGGNLGFFGTPAQPQQSGDVATAMAEYALVTSPFYDMDRVQYGNGQPLTTGTIISDYSGFQIADGFGNLTARTSLAGPNSSGITSAGQGFFNTVIITPTTLVTGVDGELQNDASGTGLIYNKGGTNFQVRIGTVTPTQGGTGLTTISQGQLIFGSASNVFSALAKNTSATRYLSNTGTSNNPAWAQIDLTTGVTGVLPAANGGSGIVGNARVTAQTAAAVLTTFTVGASDATFQISANILITSSTLYSFSCTCTYTDESNTSRVLTLNFSQLSGAFVTSLTNALGASAYEGVPLQIRCKAATTIVIQTTGTFTTVTYNFEERIIAL